MSKERGLNQKLPGSQTLRILEPRVLPCSSDVLVPDLAQDEGTTYQVMLAGSGTHGHQDVAGRIPLEIGCCCSLCTPVTDQPGQGLSLGSALVIYSLET